MISRCDADVATWSAAGDSFVIKNVEQCKCRCHATTKEFISAIVCFAESSHINIPHTLLLFPTPFADIPTNSLLNHPAPILQALKFLQLCPAAQLLRLPQAQVRPHLPGRRRRQDLDVRVLLPPTFPKGPTGSAPKHQTRHQVRTADQGGE